MRAGNNLSSTLGDDYRFAKKNSTEKQLTSRGKYQIEFKTPKGK